MDEKKKWEYPEKTVYIPKAAAGEDPFVIVSVNGIRTQIARGVRVKVKYPVYAALREQGVAIEKAKAYLEEKSTTM